MKNKIALCMSGIASLLGCAAASAQVERFATSAIVDPNNGWDYETAALGNACGDPCNNCNTSTPNTFARNDFPQTPASREVGFLIFDDFQNYTLPAGQCIDSVRVDVQCRYDSGDSGMIDVQVTGADGYLHLYNNVTFTTNDTLCRYRLGGVADLPLPPGGWTQSLVNSLQVSVRRERDGTNTDLRVKACKLIITTTNNPVSDISSVTSSPSVVCVTNPPPTVMLTAIGGSGGIVEWFTGASCGSSVIGTGEQLVVQPSVTGLTYSARRRNACNASACRPITIPVANPALPAQGIVGPEFVCAGSTSNITLTIDGGSGDSVEWFSNSCGGTMLNGSATSITIAPPAQMTTYYARWRTACGASACVSYTVPVVQLPLMPTNVTATPSQLCFSSATQTTLSANGGGNTIEWFRNDCSGQPIGTGSSLTVTVPSGQQSTVYWARATNPCGASMCVPVTVSYILPVAFSQQPESGTYCIGQTILLSVSATGNEPITYAWQRNGQPVANGPASCGSFVSGATTRILRIINACVQDSGNYSCVATNQCGPTSSNSVAIAVSNTAPSCCDSIDFNGDLQFPDVQDISDFLQVFAGGPCSPPSPPSCNFDIDFNNDGLFPDTQDISALLSRFAGGPCSR
jgi:hypothetical protein